MRMCLIGIIVSCLSAGSLAAAAPLSFPEVAVNPSTAEACLAAARELVPDPSTCDVLIQRAGVDAQTLAATHNNRGLILGAMGLQEDALIDFETALELAPGLSAVHINRANTLFLLARYPEALTAYDEALAIKTTEQHVALFNRALVHRALGNVQAAGLDLAAARQLAEPRPQPLR